MNCREGIAELVESARGQASVGRELRAHIATCASCRDRLEAERQLSVHLNMMRAGAASVNASQHQRQALMREFSTRHGRRALPAWGWALAAAASLVMAIFIGHEAGLRARHTSPALNQHGVMNPAARTRGGGTSDGVLYEISADLNALSSDDFIEVPYTPPLADGELVRVIHTEMYPETLATMGVNVDPTWADNVPVDLAVGEDDLPHAVRISNSNQN
jgi:hypothetical protein